MLLHADMLCIPSVCVNWI